MGKFALAKMGKFAQNVFMEQFIADVEAYTAAVGTTPPRFLRSLLNAEWGRWDSWKAGKAFPTARTMDRVRKHISENPAQIAA